LSLLSEIESPRDLRAMNGEQLNELCREIRTTIIETVASTGGHLGSSLGVVELTVALHRLLDSPTDKIVWDTGHQAYAHKLLTGRLDEFGTLRQLGGVGGFPRRSESEHDVFDGGHAGTGLSIAEGLALARDQRKGKERVAVVVGDAALISGIALEALNDIGHRQTRMLIILNDNEMSISPTVGALSQYLSRIKLSRTWRGSKRLYEDVVVRLPVVGPAAVMWSRRLRKSVLSFAQPGQLFEDLGITYVGPVPGHNLAALHGTLRRALRDLDGPVLVHVRTQKGRGYQPAMADQVGFHGAALPPIEMAPGADAYNGNGIAMPTESMADDAAPPSWPRSSSRWARPIRASSPSPPACPPAPAFRASRPSSRIACSTSASRSSTRSRWRPVSRSGECGPSWRSTRPSCSAPSTRPCTTSARTTRRW